MSSGVAKRSERRHPPRGKFLTVDGVRLHYLERGEGRTIVLIHGNGVTAHDYELSGLIARLSQQHRVIGCSNHYQRYCLGNFTGAHDSGG